MEQLDRQNRLIDWLNSWPSVQRTYWLTKCQAQLVYNCQAGYWKINGQVPQDSTRQRVQRRQIGSHCVV